MGNALTCRVPCSEEECDRHPLCSGDHADETHPVYAVHDPSEYQGVKPNMATLAQIESWKRPASSHADTTEAVDTVPDHTEVAPSAQSHACASTTQPQQVAAGKGETAMTQQDDEDKKKAKKDRAEAEKAEEARLKKEEAERERAKALEAKAKEKALSEARAKAAAEEAPPARQHVLSAAGARVQVLLEKGWQDCSEEEVSQMRMHLDAGSSRFAMNSRGIMYIVDFSDLAHPTQTNASSKRTRKLQVIT